jgi:hypothetical protein
MKSHGIALGASVIALALTGGSQAMATGLDSVTQQVTGHTEATVNGPAGSATVEGNVKVPAVPLPSKQTNAGDVKPLDHSSANVEVNRSSGPDRSEVFLGWDGRGTSLYAGQRRKGVLEVEGQSQIRGHGADVAANAVAKPGHTRAYRHAHDAKAKYAERGERSVERAAQAASPTRHRKGLAALRSIGREVGNPMQLSPAGWLIALLAGSGMAVARLSRGRRRFN